MKIAIQGHPTRGKEVIQILESLGGINRMNQSGCYPNYFYYISSDDNTIAWTCIRPQHMNVFTLEEFEKEFPFKISDRVISIATNLIGTITKLSENGWYYVKYDNGNFACSFGQNLKLYKEMKEERNITLTFEKAKEWYKKGGDLKQVALQAFSEKELNSLPKTWEEFCDNYMIDDSEAYFDICSEVYIADKTSRHSLYDKNMCPSMKSAEAHLALIQLEQLRDCWRQGWKPTPEKAAYAIKVYKGKLGVFYYFTREFLSFPTIEMAEEFFKCFRDLIEQAGDLI